MSLSFSLNLGEWIRKIIELGGGNLRRSKNSESLAKKSTLFAVATIEGHRDEMSSETDDGKETSRRKMGSSGKRTSSVSGSGVKSKQKLKHGRRMNRLSPGA